MLPLALLLLTLGSLAAAAGDTAVAAPGVTFATPNLVGLSNSSLPGGSNFWFPSISIPTGIKGHVAQHITLSGDGGTCPPKPPLSQFCEQIMLTTDGGRSYSVTKKIGAGTSGNFNGYGDLGSWIPPKKGAKTKPGEFKALVGCNDCTDPGGALTEPAFLQTWMDDGTTLELKANVSVTYTGTPAAFVAPGFGEQPDGAVRTKDGNLLMAFYGHAKVKMLIVYRNVWTFY